MCLFWNAPWSHYWWIAVNADFVNWVKCEPRCLFIIDWFRLLALFTTSSSTFLKKIAFESDFTCTLMTRVSPSCDYLRLTWFFSKWMRTLWYFTLFYILTVLLFWIHTTQTTESWQSRCRICIWYFTSNDLFIKTFAEIGIVFWEVQQYSSNELCLYQPML